MVLSQFVSLSQVDVVENQDLRGALDMGDMEHVTCLIDMISRGAKKIATTHRPPQMSVANMVM